MTELINWLRENFLLVISSLWLVFIIRHYFRWYLQNRLNLPPGPAGLPLIGNIFQLGKTPYLSLMKLSKKYGNIMRLRLGSREAIILNDFNAINETIIKKAEIFSNRPKGLSINLLGDEDWGVGFVNGDLWKVHRQLIVNTLKDNGVGSTVFEAETQNEIDHVMRELREKYSNRPQDICQLLQNSLNNIVSLLVIGKRFEMDHPFLKTLQDFQTVFFREAGMLPIFMFFPWLKYLPGISWFLGQEKLKKLADIIGKVLIEEFENLKKNVKTSNLSNCYSSFFLKKLEFEEKNGGNLFPIEAFMINARGLFTAGTETTIGVFYWIFLYFMKYPEVQRKCQEELDRVIGRERAPSINDRSRTPYLEATLLEVQRIASSGPLGFPRSNSKACQINGYTIPKDSYIIANFYNIHHDTATWKDPENFRPERFLDKNGNLDKTKRIFVFSTGKRNCPGDGLAKMELYLYVASLLQNFNFENPYEGTPINDDVVYKLTRLPTLRKTKLVPRF